MTATLQRSARGRALQIVLIVCAVALFAGFTALGTWQVQRRAWKLDLIERVNQRVNAAPVPVAAPADWPRINQANDEYRHVQLSGRFIGGRDSRVQAATELGAGFWVLTPLQLDDGGVVLVNRGFVPPGPSNVSAAPPASRVTLTGLLRLTEPGGGFLRKNDPAADRWYSRDVAAIAQARGLDAIGPVAPFFVDEAASDAATPAVPGRPIGGLTVIAFHNSHLVYAITWYALALMVVGASVLVARHNAKRHDDPRRTDPHD